MNVHAMPYFVHQVLEQTLKCLTLSGKTPPHVLWACFTSSNSSKGRGADFAAAGGPGNSRQPLRGWGRLFPPRGELLSATLETRGQMRSCELLPHLDLTVGETSSDTAVTKTTLPMYDLTLGEIILKFLLKLTLKIPLQRRSPNCISSST